MKVNICGIPHTVIECEDHFDIDTHFGQIDYKACEIRINKDMATWAMEETICHEMIHGILVHLGYSEQSQDETFVQALGNAIYQGFVVRVIEESEFDYEQQPCEDVLDKIRAEIEEHAKINQNLNVDRARALCWCLDVIDKYKAESEE